MPLLFFGLGICDSNTEECSALIPERKKKREKIKEQEIGLVFWINLDTAQPLTRTPIFYNQALLRT